MQTHKRFEIVDILRGLAVLLMIIFHLSYDLNLFNFIDIDFHQSLFWWAFPRVIVFLFLLPMGLAMEISFKGEVNWSRVFKRFLKIGGWAVVISISTYFAFPDKWIYFGTLHCIATCSLAATFFLGKKKLSLIAAIVILTPLLGGFQWPWPKLSHASMDYIPALPWFGVVLIGMALVHFNFHNQSVPNLPGKKLLLFLGLHSLVIYLLHQPILFALVKGVHFLLNRA